MRESLPALSFCRRGIMEKILRLNLAILFLLFAMMLVSPSAASLKNPAGSITVEAKSKKKPAKKSTTRKPVTRTNYITMKKKEKLWVGPSVAAMHPETKDWIWPEKRLNLERILMMRYGSYQNSFRCLCRHSLKLMGLYSQCRS